MRTSSATVVPAASFARAADKFPASAAWAGQSTGSAGGAAFPRTVQHKFGTTTIPARPERVVTVGYTELDTVLALYAWHGDHHIAQIRSLRERQGW